jgi:hypothetical protein
MTMPVLAACAFCAIAAFLHLASIVAVMERIRRSGVEASGGEGVEGVSIVRPVCGMENFTEQTLLSGFHLEYPNYEIVFCVAQASDPVVPLLQRLIELHPDVPARLLIGAEHISANPKLNNVAKGWAAASHAWIVMADSNVLMPPDYLHRLRRVWRADTGLVSSPPIGCAPGNVWAELECAFLNTYQARWQYFADSAGMGFAQGKTMLFRRDIVESAGGIRALASEAAEDAASTKLVRESGLRVRLVDRPFPQPLGYRTAAEVWRRQMRGRGFDVTRSNITSFRKSRQAAFRRLRPARFLLLPTTGRWWARSPPSRRSGTAPRSLWPTLPAGIFHGGRHSCGCSAIFYCRCSGRQAGSGTSSYGAAIPCASSTAIPRHNQYSICTRLCRSNRRNGVVKFSGGC